ncbi:ABC transporter permease [Sutcliffiella halmapala]
MKWSRQTKHFLAFLPALILISLVVLYALFLSFCESVACSTSWTWEHYSALFKEERFRDSMTYSLFIAGVSTLCSLVIGLGVTKLLHHRLLSGRSRSLLWLPMLFPHFVWGYMMILLFSQTGWLSSILHQMGVIETSSSFPLIIQDEYGIGIILTYISKEVPFVVLLLMPVYMNMPKELPQVVRTLGGSRWNVFKTVEWPWVYPVLVEAGIIVFAFVIAAFELPYLLGTTYPQMVSVVAYEWFFQGDWGKRPLSFAFMICITVLILLITAAASSSMNKKRYQMMRGNN